MKIVPVILCERIFIAHPLIVLGLTKGFIRGEGRVKFINKRLLVGFSKRGGGVIPVRNQELSQRIGLLD